MFEPLRASFKLIVLLIALLALSTPVAAQVISFTQNNPCPEDTSCPSAAQYPPPGYPCPITSLGIERTDVVTRSVCINMETLVDGVVQSTALNGHDLCTLYAPNSQVAVRERVVSNQQTYTYTRFLQVQWCPDASGNEGCNCQSEQIVNTAVSCGNVETFRTISSFRLGDQCPGHVDLTLEDGDFDSGVVAAGGLRNRAHEISLSAATDSPDRVYTVSLSATAGRVIQPVLEVDGRSIRPGDPPLQLSGNRTMRFRSGDTVGTASVRVTGSQNSVSVNIEMVKGVFGFPSTLCEDPTAPNQGYLELAFDETPIPGHSIRLVAEELDRTGSVRFTPAPLISADDEAGTVFEVTSDRVRRFRIRAIDESVYEGTNHPERMSGFLELCGEPFEIEAGLGGLPGDGGDAFLAAGGVSNSVHRRSFTAKTAKPTTEGRMSLSGEAGQTKKTQVVLSDGRVLRVGASPITITGTTVGVLQSGDTAGICTVKVESSAGSVTQRFNMVAGEIAFPSSICDPEKNAGRLKLTHGGSRIPGHEIHLVAEAVAPPDGTVTLTSPVITADDAAGARFGVSTQGASRFRIRASDHTVFNSGGSHPEWVSTDLKACIGRKLCQLLWKAADAVRTGLPGTRLSPWGVETGGGVTMPEAADGPPTPGCTGSVCKVCKECDGMFGDPVFLATGDLAEFHKDLSWAVMGGRLAFERSYLSDRVRPEGQLGSGWAHNFELFLQDGADGITAVDWRGGGTFFELGEDGRYTGPAGSGTTLTRQANGEWLLRFAAGAENHYRPDGKIARIRTADGSTLTMEYAVTGDLTRVVDSAGGALELTVTDGLLRSVKAKNGDRVLFAYTSGRELAVATNQAGHATSYTYAPGTGLGTQTLLASIQRPVAGEGALTQLYEYNAARQVVKITARTGDGHESVNRYAYPDDETRIFTAADGKSYAFKFKNGEIVERIDPNGDTYRIELDNFGRTIRRIFPGNISESWAYDGLGQLASHTSVRGKVTRVERDPATGFPTALIRPDGTREESHFDVSGNLIRWKNGAGEETLFTRDPRGLITVVRRPGGATTRLDYDSTGNLTTVTNAAGHVTSYQRDTLGRIAAVTTPGQRTTRAEYCSCGNVSAVIDPLGRRTSYEYDGMGSLVELTQPNGARTEIKYSRRNGHSRVSEVKDALGGLWKTEYDAVGRVVAEVDAVGRRTSFDLDDIGRVTRISLPGGNVITTRYNQAGHIREIENANRAVASFVTDPAGGILEAITADGAAWDQEFDDVGRVVKRIRPDGGTHRTIYDGADRPVGAIDAFGHLAQVQYNPTGTVTATVNALGNRTHFKYDILDRLVTRIDALDAATHVEYSSDSEVTRVVDPRTAATKLRYDDAGRITESIDALGHSVKYAYGPIGELRTLTDQNGHAWAFTHDLLGRRTSATDPNGATTQYSYTPAHELRLVIHPDRSEWRYIRDAAGRVTQRSLVRPDGSVEDIEQATYDLVGNQLTLENNASKTTSRYDSMNREVERTIVYKASGASRTLAFKFDSMGRREEMTDTHGRVTKYSYDKLSRLTEMVVLEPPSMGPIGQLQSYTYRWDAVGNLLEVAYPNQMTTVRAFDKVNRLTHLTHSLQPQDTTKKNTFVGSAFEYLYDAGANITQLVQDGQVSRYTYDLNGQLIAAVLGAGTKDVTYGYDPAGNRIRETAGNKTIFSTYSPANELRTRGDQTFRHDPRGNMVEKLSPGARHTYKFGVAGRLDEYRFDDHSKPKSFSERYSYDPANRRITLHPSTQGPLFFAWDGAVLSEEFYRSSQPSGSVDVGIQYTSDDSGQVLLQFPYAREGSVTRPNFAAPSNPKPGSLQSNRAWIHPDHLGSTTFVTAHTGGRSKSTNIYGAFGEQTIGFTVMSRYGYAGTQGPGLGESYRSAETALHYAWHRYYDPEVGRFLSRDPIGFAGGLNLYAYVGNNPINGRDPEGLYYNPPGDIPIPDVGEPVRYPRHPLSPWEWQGVDAALQSTASGRLAELYYGGRPIHGGLLEKLAAGEFHTGVHGPGSAEMRLRADLNDERAASLFVHEAIHCQQERGRLGGQGVEERPQRLVEEIEAARRQMDFSLERQRVAPDEAWRDRATIERIKRLNEDPNQTLKGIVEGSYESTGHLNPRPYDYRGIGFLRLPPR